MCVIIALHSGDMIDMAKLSMASKNNPHGWGLIIDKFDKGLEVKKEISNDVDDIIELLDANKEYDRYLHLRFATVGDVTVENLHPFKVYDKDGHTAYLMHNGTMNAFKSTDTKKSDTSVFCEDIVIPLLDAVNGKLDLAVVYKLLKPLIGISRVCIVSNHYPTLYFGEWKDINSCNKKVSVSNDDYFDAIKISANGNRTYSTQSSYTNYSTYSRDWWKEDDNWKAPANTSNVIALGAQKYNDVTPIGTTNVDKKKGLLKLVELGKLVREPEFFATHENMSLVSFLSSSEVLKYTKTNALEASFLIEAMSLGLHELCEQKGKLEAKLIKAQNLIKELKGVGNESN
jgi:hypothetical protein